MFCAQLKHVFTGKFIHVSTTQTSRRNKNNMLVSTTELFFHYSHYEFLNGAVVVQCFIFGPIYCPKYS